MQNACWKRCGEKVVCNEPLGKYHRCPGRNQSQQAPVLSYDLGNHYWNCRRDCGWWPLAREGRALVIREMEKIGTNIFAVYLDWRSDDPPTGEEFDLYDVTAIKEQVPEVKYLAPESSAYESVRAGNQTKSAIINGTTADWKNIRNKEMAQGRFLSEADCLSGKMVAVLEEDLPKNSSGTRSPIGQRIVARGCSLVVVGVLQQETSMFEGGGLASLYIPFRAWQTLYPDGYIDTLEGSAVSKETAATAVDKTIKVLERRHRTPGLYIGETMESEMGLRRQDHGDYDPGHWGYCRHFPFCRRRGGNEHYAGIGYGESKGNRLEEGFGGPKKRYYDPVSHRSHGSLFPGRRYWNGNRCGGCLFDCPNCKMAAPDVLVDDPGSLCFFQQAWASYLDYFLQTRLPSLTPSKPFAGIKQPSQLEEAGALIRYLFKGRSLFMHRYPDSPVVGDRRDYIKG